MCCAENDVINSLFDLFLNRYSFVTERAMFCCLDISGDENVMPKPLEGNIK